MPEIYEYDLYDASITITVATLRPDAAPANVLVAATVHEEYASRCRALLREYRLIGDGLNTLGTALPYYRILKMQPAGSAREIERDFNQDVMRLQFSLQFTLIQEAWSADERIVFAFERNFEKAIRDLFKANSLPDVFIAGDTETMGESWIDILCTVGGGSNIGAWSVSA